MSWGSGCSISEGDVRNVWGMTVQVPMYSASGLRVSYLKVWEKSSYKVEKWVRKVCKSGDYSIRT